MPDDDDVMDDQDDADQDGVERVFATKEDAINDAIQMTAREGGGTVTVWDDDGNKSYEIEVGPLTGGGDRQWTRLRMPRTACGTSC